MADNTEAIKNEAGNGEQKKPLEPLPQTATKQYTWTGADGTKINYTATAEMIPVRANDGQLIGHMFMFSQVSDQEDKSDRPVTFCWNGGPGGASYMVNIGGMGAKRVKTDGMAHLKGVGEVEDNPYSLLPSSDLVFIDAFGTGYSHVDPNYDAKKVWGVDGDGDAFTRGIIAWLTKYDRMNSPHYLYGESYGTMRNAVVYRMLGEHGVGVAGITEQSTILDYEPTLSGEDDYYMGMFPVYAATANYFKKAGVGVDQYEWYDKAFDYANNTLARALTLADALPADEMKKIAGEMSEFIGLPADFIEEKGLRIELDTFRKNLLKAEGDTIQLELRSDDAIKAERFPFDFVLTSTFRLDGKTVHHTLTAPKSCALASAITRRSTSPLMHSTPPRITSSGSTSRKARSFWMPVRTACCLASAIISGRTSRPSS